MEGLYLYNIIFMSVYADNSKIAKYIVMGWGKLKGTKLVELERHYTLLSTVAS